MTQLATDRFDDPMYRKRLNLLTNSQMNRDAVTICQLARRLKDAVDDFTVDHNPDTGIGLFSRAGINLPSDITGRGIDENRDWSTWVYDDVTGFGWALKSFLALIGASVNIPDEEETEGAADQEGEEVEPAVVVVG